MKKFGHSSVLRKLPAMFSVFRGMLGHVQRKDRELRKHEEQLEQQVAARTAELDQANRLLKLQSAALEAAANSIAIADRNGHILWTNPAFSKLSGYSAEEVFGRFPRFLYADCYDDK